MQPWLYYAISEVSLGDGYASIDKTMRVTILNYSKNLHTFLLCDEQYSILAIVDKKITLFFSNLAKNNKKDLIGKSFIITRFHFVCKPEGEKLSMIFVVVVDFRRKQNYHYAYTRYR